MKHNKYITLIITLFIATVMLCIPSYATQKSDSLNDPESGKFRDNESDMVVVLYNGHYTAAFAQKMEIEDILSSSECVLEKTYMVIPNNFEEMGATYKVCRNNQISTVNKSSAKDWNQFYEYAVSPTMALGESVEVNAVYCLDGTPSNNGAYIYYSTNEGDYVLYKEFLTSEETYLFPLEDFYRLNRQLQDDILNNSESEYIGVQSIGMLEDIEKYNIRNLSALTGQSRIALWLGVIGGIVLITGLCVGLIVFFRRKSQKARRFEK